MQTVSPLTTTDIPAKALVNLVLRPASPPDLHSPFAMVSLGYYLHSCSLSALACIHSYGDHIRLGLLQHTTQMWKMAGMISDSVLGCICLDLEVSCARYLSAEVTVVVSRLLTCR